MEIYKWIKFFLELEEKYNKRLFSVTELANISNVKLNYARNEINRLYKKGILKRIYQGLYSYKNPDITELISQIDQYAYITADTILYENNIINQKPEMIVCFTLKHHGRTRIKRTQIGSIVFHKVKATIYNQPKDLKASLKQAINDYLYISKTKGVDPYSQYTFVKSFKFKKYTAI